jgi:hypothetical protein
MNDTATTTETRNLERVACSRCGGSGNFSYCPMYGTTCFKCNGKGETLTKRGAAAVEYLRGLRSRKASDLKVGDRIKTTFGWKEVVRLSPAVQEWRSKTGTGDWVDHRREGVDVVLTGSCCIHCTAEEVVEVLLSKDEQERTLTLALEYQAKLTKAGTPRKR